MTESGTSKVSIMGYYRSKWMKTDRLEEEEKGAAHDFTIAGKAAD